MSELEVPTGPALAVEVVVHAGPSAGQRHGIRRFPAVVGRGRDADVRLEDDPEDPRLSRSHLRVVLQGGRVAVTDLSSNGTWVGERQLLPDEVVSLQGGEPVWLGPHTMITFEVLGAATPPVASPPGTVAPSLVASPPGTVAPSLVASPPGTVAPSLVASAPGTVAPSLVASPPGTVAPSPIALAPGTVPPARFASRDDGGVAPDAAVRAGPAPQRPLLAIRALGGLRVAVDGAVIPEAAWTARKAVALLAYLADSPGRPVPVERIEAALWPDTEEGAKAALQTAVSRLRRAFRALPEPVPDPVAFEHNAYALSGDFEVRYDVREFESLCLQARRLPEEAPALLARAHEMYADDLLPGVSDDWIVLRRSALQSLHVEATEALAALRLDEGRAEEAVTLLQPMVERDPCREQSQLLLIRAHAASGRREDALRQYQSCVRALKRILGVTPGPDLVAQYESLARI